VLHKVNFGIELLRSKRMFKMEVLKKKDLSSDSSNGFTDYIGYRKNKNVSQVINRCFWLLIFLLLSSALLTPNGWEDVYKKGPIKLNLDPEFGKDTDWETLFFDGKKQIAVAPDGSVFATDVGKDKIYKFNKNGKLLKAFGKRGQGPGDVIQPGNISILDNRCVVVKEGGLNSRFSLFDLDGRFLDIVKTPHYCQDSIALKNNKIAYTTNITGEKDNKETLNVYIIDIKTKKSTLVASFTQRRLKSRISIHSLEPKVIINHTIDRNLIVGFNMEPEISLYDPVGKKLKSFKMNAQRKKVTEEKKEKIYQKMLETIGKKPGIKKHFLNHLKNSPELFPEFLPYFCNMAIDPDGNILIFNEDQTGNSKNVVFQFYSSRGEYLGQSRIDYGQYRLHNNFQFIFAEDSLFTTVVNEVEDLYCLARVKLK
jgi:hypothetical protein